MTKHRLCIVCPLLLLSQVPKAGVFGYPTINDGRATFTDKLARIINMIIYIAMLDANDVAMFTDTFASIIQSHA